MTTAFSFYFHDYETFGLHPALDRPTQFAGIRTDENFNIISDPLVIYCRPADDYLPDPTAILITGITPQLALQKGSNEADFARCINQAFSQQNSCILGYNNIRFDDEVSRYLFYRNFYDPYAYSWQHNNSRWDLLDVVRTYYALRPDGINWPMHDNGLPSFKLEDLTRANGIEHLHAHDAMSDVYATIAMAKLLKKTQPKLFDYLFKLRNKHEVAALIDIESMKPLVHVSGMLGAERGNTTLIAPIAWHPTNKNAVIVCDLTGDIDTLIALDIDTLKTRLYTKSSSLDAPVSRIPLKLVHTNKCPVIAKENTLLPDNVMRLGLDRELCHRHHQRLKQHHQLIREKVIALFSEQTYSPSKDVDAQLYDGFVTKTDAVIMESIRNSPPETLAALSANFIDPRLKPLFYRYRARNYPYTLSEKEQFQWQHYKAEKFNEENVRHYFNALSMQLDTHQHDSTKRELLLQLIEYAKQITGCD